jgi:hypothetical protein
MGDEYTHIGKCSQWWGLSYVAASSGEGAIHSPLRGTVKQARAGTWDTGHRIPSTFSQEMSFSSVTITRILRDTINSFSG